MGSSSADDAGTSPMMPVDPNLVELLVPLLVQRLGRIQAVLLVSHLRVLLLRHEMGPCTPLCRQQMLVKLLLSTLVLVQIQVRTMGSSSGDDAGTSSDDAGGSSLGGGAGATPCAATVSNSGGAAGATSCSAAKFGSGGATGATSSAKFTVSLQDESGKHSLRASNSNVFFVNAFPVASIAVDISCRICTITLSRSGLSGTLGWIFLYVAK